MLCIFEKYNVLVHRGEQGPFGFATANKDQILAFSWVRRCEETLCRGEVLCRNEAPSNLWHSLRFAAAKQPFVVVNKDHILAIPQVRHGKEPRDF